MPLTADNWLSGLLGKPAFHVHGALNLFRAAALPPQQAFIDAKVPVNDVLGLVQLQEQGLRVIDTNVQLSRPAQSTPTARQAAPVNVRFARPDDAAAVRRVAYSSFEHDRFHRDPQIGDAIASRIKEEWAGNFFRGQRGEWMVVAEDRGEVCAFLQLLRGAQDSVIIDLVAVAERSRGRGIAAAMIEHAARECLSRPAPMTVGTQIANTASLMLYARLGFHVASASYVLHLHQKDSRREN